MHLRHRNLQNKVRGPMYHMYMSLPRERLSPPLVEVEGLNLEVGFFCGRQRVQRDIETGYAGYLTEDSAGEHHCMEPG